MSTTEISNEAGRSAELHEMAQKVAAAASARKQLEDCSPEEARALRREWGNPFAPPACTLHSIEDVTATVEGDAVPVRIYRPTAALDATQAAVVYYHGGGFVVGSVEQYDTVCQQLAARSGMVVFSVDYELAPARKIDAIHHQGFAVYRWLVEHAAELQIDRTRIAVAGDSAGGNLAIAVTLACKRNRFAMPAFQVLIYPSVDLGMTYPSVDEFASGYFLTRAGMNWFRNHYLDSPEQAGTEKLNFLAADLRGLPPAYIITAGFDPLRDEGVAYAERLAAAGVAVVHECYRDMIHGFVSFAGGIPGGMQALERIGQALQKALP